ncbi:MAG: sodium/proton-translocating pyrophosphatase [Pirellulales bacterium]
MLKPHVEYLPVSDVHLPSFAFIELIFHRHLFSIAIFGLYHDLHGQRRSAWDNAKKIVEVELKMKGTPLHDATVVGDTVGDPFKDTSSVALNPVIKFTTLFGLLAVQLAVLLRKQHGDQLTTLLAVLFTSIALFFIWRSFYGMRIKTKTSH